MAWTKKTANNYFIAYETVALGSGLGATASRYSSEIDFIPPNTDFIVISNSAGTDLSGSASDQLYIAHTSGGTFYRLLNTLRDANYAHDTNQGTSFRDLDNTVRMRYVDVSYIGGAPYYKLRVLHAAQESSSNTITFYVMFPSKGSKAKVCD